MGLHYLSRSAANKPDGVAMLINESVFKVRDQNNLEYTPRDRVALFLRLEHIESGSVISVGNTHLTFPSKFSVELREKQCKQFLDAAKMDNAVTPSIICGDFNCEIDESECVQCIDNGYATSFQNEVSTGDDIDTVSHRTHNADEVFVDHIFYRNADGAPSESAVEVTPTECYLFPKDVPADRWPTEQEWNLSDHRPLVATFEIRKR